MSNPNAGMDAWMGTFTCWTCERTFLCGGSAEAESIDDDVLGATFCSEECRAEHPGVRAVGCFIGARRSQEVA